MTIDDLISMLMIYKRNADEGEDKGQEIVRVYVPDKGWIVLEQMGQYNGELYLGIPSGLK